MVCKEPWKKKVSLNKCIRSSPSFTPIIHTHVHLGMCKSVKKIHLLPYSVKYYNKVKYVINYDAIQNNLANTRSLVCQTNNKYAISLTNTALSPRCETHITLIECNLVLIFLLCQPWCKTVFIIWIKNRWSQGFSYHIWC